MADAHKLKRLNTEHKRLDTELTKLTDQLQEIESRRAELRERLDQIQVELKQLRTKGVVVSEHAMLRFMERVEKRDLNEITTKILTPRMRNLIATLGDGQYPLAGKPGQPAAKIVVKNNVVVTVVGG